MGQKLTNRTTGLPELVDDADVPAALSSGKYVAPGAVAAHIGSEDAYATPEQLGRESATATAIDPTRAALASGAATRARANSGLSGMGKAFVGGAVSGATLGLVNPFSDAQEFQGIASGAGQIVGGFAPALLTGGESEAAAIARGVAGDAAATEHVAGALSSRFLYAGELGREPGSVGRALEHGLSRAGRAMDEAKGAGVGVESAEAGRDLVGLDRAGLRVARETEIANLQGAQSGQRTAAIADLHVYRVSIDEANPWLVVEGEESSKLVRSNRALRNALDDPRGLEASPGSLLKPLRIQEQALQRTLDDAQAVSVKFAATNEKLAAGLEEELTTLPDTATHVALSGKLARRYGSFADVKVGKGVGATIKVAREDASAFLERLRGGEVAGEGQAALRRLPELIDSNRALQAKIEAATVGKADLVSPRLAAIDNAVDGLSGKVARAESLPEKMLKGSVFGHVVGAMGAGPLGPLAHVAGAKAADVIGRLVFGRVGEAAAGGVATAKATASAFLSVAKRATPTLPVAAARVLSQARFGAVGEATAAKADLATAYGHRAAELRSATAYDATGTPRVRPDVRSQIAGRLDPIRAVNPQLADRLETHAVNRLEFLSAHLPRQPDFGTPQMGKNTWHPPDIQMRTFARYVAAADNPVGVERRLVAGHVTPEDAAAYRAIYPERAAALQAEIVSQLPMLEKKLPYARRLALTIFSGVPCDPSFTPEVIAALQGHFAKEMGSQGGTGNPTPSPQFGSIKKSAPEPTVADKRAQGA